MEYEIDTDESASIAVVRALAAYTEARPEELDPLYNVIDPEALANLIDESKVAVRVEFEYCGYDVAIDAEKVYVDENVE
ncbi:HalOD1 output domain-containing protein [Halopiger xanaduensis]|uniref:Halobacterial output domain-containing protein n=1 Tax=Halopiger xanaduensis (strain DSM 18323 / JCM 14033 / SH-6) TaxID=797210 RepID=F8DDW3_HALXS|nr:HalOD1 output domain-containing protein [Halopiger xanaduensis]AEH39217.1 hypothetical protein Halxa_0634 [Halopiger xanaduensis SH-6]